MAALLHERFPALREALPRLELLTGAPSPVRAADGLAPGLWVKDDALVARPWGGNKPRKLEWTLADAHRRRCRTVLTFGALATNHGLATALYAREHGLRCVLALVEQPRDDDVEAKLERIRAAAWRVHLTRSSARTVAAVPWLLARYAHPWPPRLPYWLPPGGSSPVGTVGFVEAGLELAAQVRAGELPEPETVVVALGTGGSAAGLLVGLRLAGLPTRVVAVRVNDQLRLSTETVFALARRTLALLRRRGAAVPALRFGAGDLAVPEDWLGPGYGHATPDGAAAIAAARDAAGLALEPVYTGKALAAVLAGGFPAPVLFWNTHSGV